MREMDPAQAAAESRLQRLDDAAELAGEEPLTATDAPAEEVAAQPYGFHFDDPDGEVPTDELEVVTDDLEADALDVLAEAFNARDLESLLDVVASDGEAPGLLSYDRDNLPDALQDLWQRRPTCCMTRGHVDDEYVGVLWEYDGSQWWQIAVVHVDDVVDGLVGVIEFGDDPALLEQVVAESPDGDLEEGARWAEWEEGADGDEA